MGINCCSHEKEPSEITILKSEKNILNTIQNDNNNIVQTKEILANNNIIQAIDLEQSKNNFYQDINYNETQNNTSALNQKETDDIFNKAFQNINNNQEINLNTNNNENFNQDLNIEEILKKQTNQTNTDLDIEELLKNTTSNQNHQINDNNINYDALFNKQEDSKFDAEYINKIFESTEKRNNNSPLFYSQQIQPPDIKGTSQDNDKYYSPQNSGVFLHVSSKI